jgi:SAM-dependent methyltransferase
MGFPYPPERLVDRVGRAAGLYDYDAIGEACRRDILAMVPPSFPWHGARVLDFGCGAGRTLRQFAAEAEHTAEFSGCDIDPASIDWVTAHLCPPFRAFRNEADPPLPFADGSLDLVYAYSVFTHLADSWSAWLLEIHRVLAPGATLIATFLGRASQPELGLPLGEDNIGMLVTQPTETFTDNSGPVVYHSEWWLREHWGRLFDIVELRPWAFTDEGLLLDVPMGHGTVAMRKRDVALSLEDLERPSDDRREWRAFAANLDVVHGREEAWRVRALAAERELAGIKESRSWRLAQTIARAGRPLARSDRAVEAP